MNKIKKNIYIVLISIIMTSTMCGCGKIEHQDVENEVPLNGTSQQVESNNINSDSNDISKNSTDSINSNSTSNVSIPETFPVNVVPLIDDADIIETSNPRGNGGIVTYNTKKTVDEVYEFYKGKFEQCEKYSESKEDNEYNSFAEIDGYKIVVAAVKNDNDVVQVVLNVVPK